MIQLISLIKILKFLPNFYYNQIILALLNQITHLVLLVIFSYLFLILFFPIFPQPLFFLSIFLHLCPLIFLLLFFLIYPGVRRDRRHPCFPVHFHYCLLPCLIEFDLFYFVHYYPLLLLIQEIIQFYLILLQLFLRLIPLCL